MHYAELWIPLGCLQSPSAPSKRLKICWNCVFSTRAGERFFGYIVQKKMAGAKHLFLLCLLPLNLFTVCGEQNLERTRQAIHTPPPFPEVTCFFMKPSLRRWNLFVMGQESQGTFSVCIELESLPNEAQMSRLGVAWTRDLSQKCSTL